MSVPFHKLPFSIGISANKILAHDDPIQKSTVHTDIFIDTKTGASFGIDTSFVDQSAQLAINNPYEKDQLIFLFIGGEKNSKGQVMRVDCTEFNQDWLTIIALYSLMESTPDIASKYSHAINTYLSRAFESVLKPGIPWSFQLLSAQGIEDMVLILRPLILAVIDGLHIDSDKLFMVLPEQMSAEEWFESLGTNNTIPELWTEYNISGDTGFEAEDTNKILSLEPAHILTFFTESCHVVTRLR